MSMQSNDEDLLFAICQNFRLSSKSKAFIDNNLKVALQILGQKFYKNTKKLSLYSQSLLIFFHKTPVVKNHLTTGEMRELIWPRSIAHLHTGNTQKKVQNIEFDEDIMENIYMFVMLWNLSVISHLIFPHCFF